MTPKQEIKEILDRIIARCDHVIEIIDGSTSEDELSEEEDGHYSRHGENMKWMIKLGEDCDYEDYGRMLENCEFDDIMPAARYIVDQFIEQYPTVPIDKVLLSINKDDTAETKICTAGATPGDDVKIAIKAVGEKASDAEYREQRNADSYNALCDLRQKFGLMEEDMTENKSEVNFLMAEISSLHSMVSELAHIIDEDRDPTKPTKGFE